MAAARSLATARWRHASSGICSSRSLCSRFIFPHVCDRQIFLSSPVKLPECLGSIQGLGHGNDFEDSNSETCHSVSTRLSCSAVGYSERFYDGVRQPGSVFQTRGLASKPKKAKSSTYSYASSMQALFSPYLRWHHDLRESAILIIAEYFRM